MIRCRAVTGAWAGVSVLAASLTLAPGAGAAAAAGLTPAPAATPGNAAARAPRTVAAQAASPAQAAPGAPRAPTAADVEAMVGRIEAAARAADVDAYLALLADEADQDAARAFAADAIRSDVEDAAAAARFLRPVAPDPDAPPGGAAYELTVEVLTERGVEGRLQTWRLGLVAAAGRADDAPAAATSSETETSDVSASGPGASGGGASDIGASNVSASVGAPAWRIIEQERVDVVEGLLNLSLNPDVAYDAAGLVVTGEDMTLRMSRGTAFAAETNAGRITALVLIGDGVLTFTPAPEAERGQVRILTGRDTLEAELTTAFVRVNPRAFASRVSGPAAALPPRPVDADRLERARAVFDTYMPLSFGLDLSGLSDKAWSLTPGAGDFIADLQTERYGALTFAQSRNLPEDVSLYERETQRIIALYPSARKRAERGRYYGDDDARAYDVLDYRITASFQPSGVARESLRARPRLRGCFIDGRARLAIRVTGPRLTSLTLRLADDLAVESVVSEELGPLLFFRMRGRGQIVISLPGAGPPAGAEFTLDIAYAGLLEAQELDENWIGRQQQTFDDGGGVAPFGIAAPRYIYSGASDWYPRASGSDYATATLDLTVPAGYGVIASGEPADDNPPVGAAADGRRADDAAAAARRFRYLTLQPTRYLACVISRFSPPGPGARTVTMTPPPEAAGAAARRGVSYDRVALAVAGNARTGDRLGGYYTDAADMIRFYASLVGDAPYPSFTLALTDAVLPGGHSPAYFAVLNQPLPRPRGGMLSWRTDPVAFSQYPSFFLAHEIAHQWWGQAVGWKNYHEQWLSEGLAQYFAALYAEHRYGAEVFADVIARMREWSLRHSDQGPVYLGNRLGRLADEPRVFRALVYNKAAMVLHMLRRTVGDEAFFAGLRGFYDTMRFRAAGTDDLIRAFEAATGRPLTAFFDRWIHEAGLPDIAFSYRIEPAGAGGAAGAGEAILRFEQRGTPFELPITVTIRYGRNDRETVIVPVAGAVTERRVPLRGRVRGVDVNADGGALVEVG